MPEPVFTETTQIGIVVRDLDATMRRYADDFGIGPWQTWEVRPGTLQDVRVRGQPAEYSCRAAYAMVGHVQWELIQPLDDTSLYARFLAERGEGVHHVAVATRSFDDALAAGTKGGKTALLSCKFEDIRVAYLDSEGDLGVPVEIFSAMPGSREKPDAKP